MMHLVFTFINIILLSYTTLVNCQNIPAAGAMVDNRPPSFEQVNRTSLNDLWDRYFQNWLHGKLYSTFLRDHQKVGIHAVGNLWNLHVATVISAQMWPQRRVTSSNWYLVIQFRSNKNHKTFTFPYSKRWYDTCGNQLNQLNFQCSLKALAHSVYIKCHKSGSILKYFYMMRWMFNAFKGGSRLKN